MNRKIDVPLWLFIAMWIFLIIDTTILWNKWF
jgi:hypothetical protein